LALVFTGVHSLAIWLDPFMRFTPAEVFIPLLSHYRPIWVAMGIVSAYLLLAIWLSERVQKQIGYAWWRRLHYLTFGVWGLVTVHGLTTGSDTKTLWALLIYGGSALLVGWLLAIRLLGKEAEPAPHPLIAAATGAVALVAFLFVLAGPLRPGWNALANNGPGIGVAGAASSGALRVPFTAQLQGSLSQAAGSGRAEKLTLRINANLSGGEQGTLQIALDGQQSADGSVAVGGGRVTLSPPTTSTYSGRLMSMNGNQLVAVCSDSSGNQVRLAMSIQDDGAGNITGTVRAT
jgi:hypothetical protein